MYLFLKSLHVTCALLSISGFMLRGYWMMQGSVFLKNKVVKILPHIIDTIFLVSGLSLVFILNFNVLNQAWLLSKIFLLFTYIILGVIAFRSNNKVIKLSAFIAAILSFIYIVGIAITKSPASWFS